MSFISNIVSESSVKSSFAKIGSITKKSFGPLAVLDMNNADNLTNFTGSSTIRYPLDVGDPAFYPHTIEFQCWHPVPKSPDQNVQYARSPIPTTGGAKHDVKQSLLTKTKAARESNFASSPSTITQEIKPQMDILRIQEKFKRSNELDLSIALEDFDRNAVATDLIALYLPPGAWNDSISNDYQTKSLTEALGAAGLAMHAFGAMSEAVGKGDSVVGSLISTFQEKGAEVVAGLIGADKDTIRDVFLLTKGFARNPQFEVIYNNTQMREFQFDFVMTPRNKKEAESCILIVKRFKYHASPEFFSNSGRYLTPPSYFDITFKHLGARNEYLPRITTCVLQAVDINYSGGLEQWASYSDGMPIQIQMVLKFTELQMMHKGLRDEGY